MIAVGWFYSSEIRHTYINRVNQSQFNSNSFITAFFPWRAWWVSNMYTSFCTLGFLVRQVLASVTLLVECHFFFWFSLSLKCHNIWQCLNLLLQTSWIKETHPIFYLFLSISLSIGVGVGDNWIPLPWIL